MRRSIGRLLLGWILGALLPTLVGCAALTNGAVIDGWELGQAFDCGVVDGCDVCVEYLDPALATLEIKYPDHAPIVEQHLYLDAHPVARSGGPLIVAVFRLADGSTHAIGVGRIGIGGIVAFDAPDKPWFPGGTEPERGQCGPKVASRPDGLAWVPRDAGEPRRSAV